MTTQLIYRGISHSTTPSIMETTESMLFAKHRGVSYLVRRGVHPPSYATPIAVQYRGRLTVSHEDH